MLQGYGVKFWFLFYIVSRQGLLMNQIYTLYLFCINVFLRYKIRALEDRVRTTHGNLGVGSSGGGGNKII